MQQRTYRLKDWLFQNYAMLYRTSIEDPWHSGMYTDPDPRIRTSDKRIRIREAQNNTDPDAESLKYSESLW